MALLRVDERIKQLIVRLGKQKRMIEIGNHIKINLERIYKIYLRFRI